MTVIILPQSRQNGQTAAARLAEEIRYSLSVLFCPFLFLCSYISPITFAKPLNMKYICVYVKDGYVCAHIHVSISVGVCL